MDSGIRYRHEVDGRVRVRMDAEGHECRRHFVGDKAQVRTRSDFDEQEMLKRQKKYMVKGRMTASGVKLWDVYRVEGTKVPMLVSTGFAWPEEAVAHARELSLGRFSVGYSGIKGTFEKKGGLLMPSRSIDLPNQSAPAKVQKMADGSLLVS